MNVTMESLYIFLKWCWLCVKCILKYFLEKQIVVYTKRKETNHIFNTMLFNIGWNVLISPSHLNRFSVEHTPQNLLTSKCHDVMWFPANKVFLRLKWFSCHMCRMSLYAGTLRQWITLIHDGVYLVQYQYLVYFFQNWDFYWFVV